MEAEDQLAMQVSLLNLALKVYPENVEYVNEVLNQAFELLTRLKKDEYVVILSYFLYLNQLISLLSLSLCEYIGLITRSQTALNTF